MKNQHKHLSAAKGLVFSPNDTSRRKKAFALTVVLILIQAGSIWPIYPFFASPTPLIFGIPFSFFWVILLVVFSFTALLVFYLFDSNKTDNV